MGAGALTICHNRAAIQIKQDMKRMAQLPLLKQRTIGGRKMFGVSLLELKDLGYVGDGVPLVVRSMVEFLKEHALQQEGLFRVNGNVRAVDTLRQRLENGEEVDLLQEGDVCTVASLLKQFLRDLPEGLIPNSLQPALLKQHRVSRDDQFIRDLRGLLQQLPDVHYSLLKYLCHFLTQVEKHQKDNRMTALNLATVFGPNVFHVSLGFDGMLEQNVCNKIMAKLIQNYCDIFESNGDHEDPEDELSEVITVKEASAKKPEVERSPCKSGSGVSTPAPRKKQATCSHPPDYADPSKRSPRENLVSTQREKKAPCSRLPDNADPSPELSGENQTSTPRKKKVKKMRSEGAAQTVPQPAQSAGLPQVRTLAPGKVRAEEAVLSSDDVITVRSTEASASFQDDERPISPFYMRSLFTSDHCKADSANVLERTIRSAVEQHLFDVRARGGQSSEDSLSSLATTARQRRRQQRDQDEARKHKNTDGVNKENIPSVVLSGVDGERRPSAHGYVQESMRHRPSQLSPTLAELSDNQDSLLTCLCTSRSHDRTGMASMESIDEESFRRYHQKEQDLALSPTTSTMKIQEVSSSCDMGKAQRSPDADRCEDVPRLDLSTLIEDSHWGDPVPAYPSWQRESMDREEARISPHVGGRLIRQLLEEDSDPMLSPRSYAFGHSQQYLDDPEVPPSPPNAHSFMSRRRSSSLGSCEDDREELTSAQISKKIHSLKRKIHKYEEKFEEERKYRPSHSDKAANPEVLRWMNELSKLRKDLKELKLMKSEEDLPPVTRQRSNTLPKSFGSQLERKPLEKAPKPPVENTLEAVQKKLLEKREEVGRPEDIKDMTREQISAEKVALQKALLHYESIHGRPVTKSERQTMKPLYDRYRLVKQILCRASTIPVIGSPSSKRRGPLLQPIIEGEPALFFDHIKEEEDGSEDDGDAKTQFTMSIKPEFSMLGFLDQLDEEVDGFVSPVDELSPSKNSTDMRLSNLHSATMPELVEQLQETREEKKRIRKSLREFEDQFFRQNGRSVQKEDRSPLAEEYNEYKHVKAKLRLLEVLISKRGSSKLI